MDTAYVKNNMADWTLLAHGLGKTISAHFKWAHLLAALENAGPTQFIFDNLAKVMSKYPGLRFFAQSLVSAAGNRLQAVQHRSMNRLMRHGDQQKLFISQIMFSTSGRAKRQRSYNPQSQNSKKLVCRVI